jgi:UDP-2,4-diacetamido-2,4,6-trideoxy-beta-L-altropyranose hydrolase
MGSGHLVRCLALGKAFAALDWVAEFIVSPSSAEFCRSLNLGEWSLHVLQNSNFPDQVREIDALKHSQDYRILVVDGYHFDEGYRRSLQELGWVVVAIDDNAEGNQLYADVILNPSTTAAGTLDYSAQPNTPEVLAGNKYRLLRREFVQQDEIPFEERSGIVVIMGGSDPKQMSGPIIQALEGMSNELGEEPVCCVIGPGVRDKETLKKQVSKAPVHFTYQEQPSNLAGLFAKSRFVISSAGSTQFELLALRVPSLLLIGFENQRNSVEAEAQGWAVVQDVRSGFCEASFCEAVRGAFTPQTLREMHRQTPAIRIDGSMNAARSILNRLA